MLLMACSQSVEANYELCSEGMVEIPVMLIHPSDHDGKDSDTLDLEMLDFLDEANTIFKDNETCISFKTLSVNENDVYDSSLFVLEADYLEEYTKDYRSVIPIYLFDKVTDEFGGVHANASAYWLEDHCKRVVGITDADGPTYAHELGHQMGLLTHSDDDSNVMYPSVGQEFSIEQKEVMYDFAVKYLIQCV